MASPESTVLSLLLLLGCPSPTPDDTGDTGGGGDTGDDAWSAGELPPLAACLIPVGADAADVSDDVYAAELSGVVVDAGSGAPPSGCQDREAWLGLAEVDLDPTLAVWLVLRDEGGEEWELSVTSGVFPDPTVLLGLATTLSARSVLAAPFDGRSAETHVALASEGFRGWVGRAGRVEALTPNEPLTLAAGAEEASWSDDCLDYTRWALAGTDADETLEVPTGEVEGFGGLALFSGGLVTAANPRCSETLGDYVGAATWSFPE